ncbi:hypothetical protein N7481_001018 [Penicillium waksmanii]|uniref:uncharacterized protein n=1 Tax=Penicillium waksmanii TaxID=69791 RepID=UPI002546C9A3|nr:uncharacterized protein N7481_001018 [Penicillium waksmanii]KAJ6000609.1 hypothetical protein N7481_001018 [Penicillium waksmanii]
MHQNLLDTVPPDARPAQVIIIGCGDHSMIIPYMEETTDEFPIYSDPSGKIYDKLQMNRTTAFTDPPPYAELSLRSSFAKCMKQIWKRGLAGLKGGNWDQQGGEWIFVDGKLRYAHRMEASNDHLTADRLMDILKTDYNRKGGEVPVAVPEDAEDAPQVQASAQVESKEEDGIKRQEAQNEVENP